MHWHVAAAPLILGANSATNLKATAHVFFVITWHNLVVYDCHGRMDSQVPCSDHCGVTSPNAQRSPSPKPAFAYVHVQCWLTFHMTMRF